MSGPPLRVSCPAKVNLVLRVLARREDGYHELDTVFQALELRDRLSLWPARTLELECDHPELPVDEGNLVLRAARMLAERHGGGGQLGARLVLEKTIPLQAGLGGGSSDAAAALVLCNHHWKLGLGAPALTELAAKLGADVPFFLTGGTARGRGRGDRIERLPFVGEATVVLGFPPFGIPTTEVFGRVAERLTLPGNGVSVRVPSALKWREGKDFAFLANDLEAIVFEGWPELGVFRDALVEAGAGAALLSGSGSTVYGVFQGPEVGARAAVLMEPRFARWRVLTTRFAPDGIRWES